MNVSLLLILISIICITIQCSGKPINEYDLNTNETNNEELQKEMDSFNELLQQITLDENIKYKLKDKIEQVIKRMIQAEKENLKLTEENASLKKDKIMAEELALFEFMKQQIYDYEEKNFPQPSDNDFEKNTVIWDKQRLNGKIGNELKEERCYQQFKFYLENPPNESVKKLYQRLKTAKIPITKFSAGIAKAYRLISDDIQTGYAIKRVCKNLEEFFGQEDVVTSMVILLDEMGISKNLLRKIQAAAAMATNKGVQPNSGVYA